jgi:hypothetical protein
LYLVIKKEKKTENQFLCGNYSSTYQNIWKVKYKNNIIKSLHILYDNQNQLPNNHQEVNWQKGHKQQINQ